MKKKLHNLLQKLKLQLISQSHQLKRLKLKLPSLYGDQTVKIAFEFGLVLAETAKKLNIEVTKEVSERAEEVLIKELRMNGTKKTAMNFVPLIMAILEVDETKNTPQ